MYEVVFNEEIDPKKWNEFVEKHPEGTVFQTFEMFEVYQRASHNQPIAIAVQETGIIKGVLLAVVVWNGDGLIKLATARGIIVGGPLVANNDEIIIQTLLFEYRKRKPWYVVYSEMRPIYHNEVLDGILQKRGFRRKGHYNIQLPVDVEKESLWNQLHKERKRNILHAEKVGLIFKEVHEESEIEQIVSLIEQTYRRKHVPMSYADIFMQVKKVMYQYVHFFAAYYEDKMVAGQIRLCFRDMVYAWFAGSDERYFKQRPNDFLMWNVICWAHDEGYSVFDFGGGGEPGVPYGVRDYKLKYGCKMYDYGRFQSFHRPLMYRFGEFGANLIIKR